jgi:glycosyltransferase involved in cell wall biosynthesis
MKRKKAGSAQHPLVSIITAVLNGEKYLEQAVKSVIGQTYDNCEYLVIDGRSTDGTLDIIRKYQDKIDFWISEPDSGIFDAMNKGIEKASGEFIGMLNADDWYEADIVEAMVDKLNGTPPASTRQVIYCDYYQYDERFNPHYRTKKYSNLSRRAGMPVSHQAMFVHRDVYEELGQYDLRYRLASDFDFFLRMIKADVEFIKADVHGVTIRKGGQSTINLKESVRETGLIVRKHFGLFSMAYCSFLFTNRVPSLVGRLQSFLYKYAGQRSTNFIRKLWRRLKPRSEDLRI